MGWSINIGSIAGTAIRLHITFLLFLGWIFFASYAAGGAAAAFTSLAFMLLLFACVVAHEFGHIFMARRFGVTTPTVTLLPIGGVAQLERIPEKPWEEFLVAIAGPAVNVVIAAALVLLFGASLDGRNLTGVDNSTVGMLDRLAAVNLFLVLFNMIPAFPDGWRPGSAGGAGEPARLCARHRDRRHHRAFVAFALGFIGLFGNPLLIFIAIFVYLAAASEAQLVAVRAMSRGVPVRAAMITQFAALSPDAPIDRGGGDVAAHQPERIPGGRWRCASDRRARPQRPDPSHQETRPRRPGRRGDDQPAAVRQPSRQPRRGVPRAAGEIGAGGGRGRCGGRLIGLVTSETIAEMLMVRDALPKGPLGPWSRPAGGMIRIPPCVPRCGACFASPTRPSGR